MIFCTYTEIYIPIPLMVHKDQVLDSPSPPVLGWLGPRKWQFSVQLGHKNGGCSLDVRSCGALISAEAANSGGRRTESIRITTKKA